VTSVSNDYSTVPFGDESPKSRRTIKQLLRIRDPEITFYLRVIKVGDSISPALKTKVANLSSK
jgi:hypothetical protein